MIHQNENIARAIVALDDALCKWNRDTGRDCALIIRDGSFGHRSLNGKPIRDSGVSDDDLLIQAMEPDEP